MVGTAPTSSLFFAKVDVQQHTAKVRNTNEPGK